MRHQVLMDKVLRDKVLGVQAWFSNSGGEAWSQEQMDKLEEVPVV